MKLLKFTFIFLLFYSITFAQEHKSYIGVLTDKIFSTPKEAIIASKIWTEYSSQRGYKNVFIKFYEHEDNLLNAYINNKIDSVIVTYEMYYENKSILENISGDRWIATITEDVFEQYYLIKNKDSKVTFNNLNSKVIYYKNYISRSWLELLILKQYHKPLSKVVSKITDIIKPHKLIMNVFFDKSVLAIVPKKFYEDMLELNPQIKNKIQILKKSEKIFLSGIGFTNKKYNSYYDDMIPSLQRDISDNGQIKLTDSIKIHNLYNISNKELKPLDDFFNEYKILKKRYK